MTGTRGRAGGVPWWGLLSSAAAPVLLIGGWTLAAARQRGGFDAVRETISVLAARGADDRWVMTVALAGLGLCHLATAAALGRARTLGRVVLAAGGVATVLVAAFPLPAADSGSAAHTAAAGSAFLALAVWPLLAWSGDQREWPLRAGPCLAAGAGLLALVGWFFVELAADTGRVGLSERTAAGAQAVWPMAVAWGVRLAHHRDRAGAPG